MPILKKRVITGGKVTIPANVGMGVQEGSPITGAGEIEFIGGFSAPPVLVFPDGVDVTSGDRATTTDSYSEADDTASAQFMGKGQP